MRRVWPLAGLLLLLVGPSSMGAATLAPHWDDLPSDASRAQGLVIVLLVPRTDAGTAEAVGVLNAGAATVDLGNVALHDGEGSLDLGAARSSLPSGETLLVASDPQHLEALAGWRIDAAWDAGTGTAPFPSLPEIGEFRLSNDGETLWLTRGGSVIDAVVYGKDRRADAEVGDAWRGASLGWSVGENEVLRRRQAEGVPLDSDGAWDWRTPRRFFLTQTELPVFTFGASDVEPLLFPGEGDDRIVGILGNATQGAFVSYYELTDTRVMNVLMKRAATGMPIEVHIESAPVGESEQDRALRERWLGLMRQAGVRVFEDDDRYAFRHGKFGGTANGSVWVASENLKSPLSTSRGWGAAFRSEAAYAWLGAVARDGANALLDAPPGPGGPDLLGVAPDHTVPGAGPTPILDLLAGAQGSIRMEQLNLPLSWSPMPWGGAAANPYVEALVEAARRGVNVSLVVSGAFHERGEGNRATASFFEDLAAEGLPVRVEVHESGDGGFSLLHNKALVVDERWVVVGSLNLNRHAAAENREVFAILDDPALARVFVEAFESDLRAAALSGGPARDLTLAAVGLVAILISAALLLGAILRKRR